MKSILALVSLSFLSIVANAQSRSADSTRVAKELIEFLHICKHVDFGDPKTTQIGTFYKAAPYIVYRGEDAARKWKDLADYSKEEDKRGVDETCIQANQTANQDDNYKIVGYRTEKESEGTWHALIVSYNRKGKPRQAAFAFLFVKGKYRLGDIDNIQ